MKHKSRWRIAAICLACSIAISTPVMAYSDNLISDLKTGRTLTAQPDKDIKQKVNSALNNTLAYIKANVTSPVVDTIGGEWSVMAMSRNNKLSEQARMNYITNLLNTLDSKNGVLHRMKYTEYSRVAMALTSIGADPSNIGGYDILQPLAEFDKVYIQGINGPIFALIAFDTKKYDIPLMTDAQKGAQTTREGLIQYILDHQLPKGGWGLADTPDDMTPMAIQSLAPYYDRADVKAAVDKAVDIWSSLQKEDGGFSAAGGSETVSQTIIALSALDSRMLQSEKFIKNGNTLLDALLSYQMTDGSFRHVADGPSDLMSSDQAALALTAYDRALNGKTRLYDMTDVKTDSGMQDDAKIEIIKQELENLSEYLSLDDKERIYSIQAQLEQMKDFEGKEDLLSRLAVLKEKLDAQRKEVKEWDDMMWTKIDPQNITIQDKSVIEGLRKQYDEMLKENRNYLEHSEDLMMAEEKILALENGSEILTGLKDEPSYQVQGKGNAGSDISVSDSSYSLQTNNKRMPKETGKKSTSSESSGEETVKDGITAASFFEKIQGKDENVEMKWHFEDGTKYTMTINGEDVKEVKDMNIQLIKGSIFEEDIKKLSKDPYMFYFADKGTFPGQMQVEMDVNLEDGQYLLLKYNKDERRAQYIQKIDIKDGKTKFILKESGDYFISQKAYSKSLDEIEKGEKIKDKDVMITGTKDQEKNELPVIVLTAAGIIFIVAVILWISRKKGLK